MFPSFSSLHFDAWASGVGESAHPLEFDLDLIHFSLETKFYKTSVNTTDLE